MVTISRFMQRADHETCAEGEQQRRERKLVSWSEDEGVRNERCECAVNRKASQASVTVTMAPKKRATQLMAQPRFSNSRSNGVSSSKATW